MAQKEITVRLEDIEQKVLISSSINRDTIYGKTSTIPESEGIQLKRGYLAGNGEMFARKEIDYNKTDNAGSLIETPITDNIDKSEIPEKLESSYTRGLTLKPITLEQMLEQPFDTYYHVEGLTITEGFYQTNFNFRKGVPSKAILVVRKDGNGFLQLVNERLSTWIGESESYEFFDEEELENEEEDISFQF
jgi:hypothetical protein